MVDLHPLTIAQNARTSGGGNISLVPTQAISVGPVETWKAEKVSIWQAGTHDNPFGQRLTCLMIAKRIADAAVPMSLLADHPNVQFNYYRKGSAPVTWRCTEPDPHVPVPNTARDEISPMSAKYWNRLSHERELWQSGLTHVAGVDEAGCGPLAGPVVAAAVVFPVHLAGDRPSKANSEGSTTPSNSKRSNGTIFTPS